MSWNDYRYEESTAPERKPGVYRCVISDAEITTAKSSGARMLKLSLRPSGSKSVVYGYIIDNDHFNQNFSEFLDAFPELGKETSPDNCYSFVGAEGAVKLTVDDNGFFRTAQYPWIAARKAETMTLPPYVWVPRDGEAMERPVYEGFSQIAADEDDDLPFM